MSIYSSVEVGDFIKLCGKRVDNGEWVFGSHFCLHHNDSRTHLHHFIIPDNTDIPKEKSIGEIQVEVIPETIGLFSLKKDKNGKEIYSGHIIKMLNGILGIVRFGVYLSFCPVDEVWMDSVGFWVESTGLQAMPLGPTEEYAEIVGNLHDFNIGDTVIIVHDMYLEDIGGGVQLDQGEKNVKVFREGEVGKIDDIDEHGLILVNGKKYQFWIEKQDVIRVEGKHGEI